MKMKLAMAVLMLSASLAHAEATPEEVAAMGPEALGKLSALELCNAWHALKLEGAREYLERKHGFTRRTWWVIKRDFPDSLEAMNYSHVVCMWGMPHEQTREPTMMGIKRRLTYRMDGHVFTVHLLNEAVTGYDERRE